MNIVPRIRDVLADKPDEVQLDKYLSDLREALTNSNKQFINYPLLAVAALVIYFLVALQGETGLTFSSVRISDTKLFRKVFLVVPAALLCAAAAVGYLRRCQREVYDYLTISRYRVLATTGLHELRLPSDYLLGLFLLHTEAGFVGKVVSALITVLATSVFTVGPAAYIVSESIENFRVFGAGDLTALVAGGIAIVLAVCSLVVVFLAARIKAT